MGSLLPHNSLWTRPFFRRSSSPTLSQRPRSSAPRRFALPLLCLVVILVYELRVRYLQSSLAEALSTKHVIHISHSPAIQAMDDGRPSLRALRRSYERKRRKEEFNKRLNGMDLGEHSSYTVPEDKVELVQTLLAGTGGEISPGILDWTMVDEEDFGLEIGAYWPDWWTSADVVGSMWDYRPKEREETRLLFLTDYTDYLERMNSHTYEIVDAALRIPHLKVDVWGPGWAGYDRHLSLSTNIRRRQCRLSELERWDEEAEERRDIAEMLRRANRTASGELETYSTSLAGDTALLDEAPTWSDDMDCGCSDKSFHVVWTISDIFKQSDPHVNALDCGSLLVQQIGDCHSLNCFNEWYPQANNITLSKYAFELLEIFDHGKVKARYPDWEMGLFGHSPDTGNEWDFYPVPWAEKLHNVTIFGFQGSFYPLRTTVSSSIDSNPVPWIRKHPHPGYDVAIQPQATQFPLETYRTGHEYYAGQEEIRRDFAQGMRETQICLFDASLERKMIRKFAQALLSGCVIAADLPTEHERALSQFVIPLSPDMDMEQIEQVLKGYLDTPERLEQMALEGFVYARQYLTTTRKVDDVLRMAEDYRSGARGYDFSFGFSSKCRKYWSDEDSYRPPWCWAPGEEPEPEPKEEPEKNLNAASTEELEQHVIVAFTDEPTGEAMEDLIEENFDGSAEAIQYDILMEEGEIEDGTLEDTAGRSAEETTHEAEETNHDT